MTDEDNDPECYSNCASFTKDYADKQEQFEDFVNDFKNADEETMLSGVCA